MTALARWRGRWRIALRSGAREARRNKARTALVAVLVGLPVLGGAGLLTGLESTEVTDTTIARDVLGPDLQAQLQLFHPSGAEQSSNGQQASVVDHGADAEWPASAELEAQARAELADGATLVPYANAGRALHGPELETTVGVLTTDLSVPQVAAAVDLRAGDLPGAGEIAVYWRTAQDLGLEIGDTVGTEGLGDLTLTGLLTKHQPTRAAAVAHVPDGALPAGKNGLDESLADRGWYVAGVPVTWGQIRALNEHGFVVTSRDALVDPPDPSQVALAAQTEGAGDRQQLLLVLAVAGIGLFEAVLLIGPAFAVGARRQERALGLVAANGGDARALRAISLGSAAVTGLAASAVAVLLGVLAGTVGVWWFEIRGLVVPWPQLGLCVLIGLLITLVAAWQPARRAARQDPVLALAGRRSRPGPVAWLTVAGVALTAVGLLVALLTAPTGRPLLLAGGIVVAELGLAMLAGPILSGLGRLAPVLPVAWRFALRDAARQRGRSAPAIAAVLVAVAAAVGSMVFAASSLEHDRRSYTMSVTEGTLAVTSGDTADGLAPWTAPITDQVRRFVPDAGPLVPVDTLASSTPGTTAMVFAEPPDPEAFGYAGGGAAGGPAFSGTLVDDGTLAEYLAYPDPDRAATALAAGKVVVPHGYLWPDGTAHLTVNQYDSATGDDVGEPRTVVVPAVAAGDGLYESPLLPVVPPALVDELGLTTTVGALVGRPDTMPNQAQIDTLDSAVGALGTDEAAAPSLTADVERGFQDFGTPQAAQVLLIGLVAGFVALAAVWMAAALAAAESRPDLATLSAVGASPGTRRGVAGAQAGVIAVTGTLLGLVTGPVLGIAFVLYKRFEWGEADPAWLVEVPWLGITGLVVALPLLGVAAAWLVTRSRVDLTRRLDG
ncbi:hypothetical protein GCM10027063_29950 [Promicromonospora xylanilytica]